MKGQPLAYNKDNQEDKEPLFDTVDTRDGLAAGLHAAGRRHAAAGEGDARGRAEGYATATDLADYLVRKGLPFRDAHEAVARAVRAAEAAGCDLAALPLQDAAALLAEDRRGRVHVADARRLGRRAQPPRRHGAGAGAGGRRAGDGRASAQR